MKRIITTILSLGFFCISSFAFADTITVSAAASLTNAFKEIGEAFEAKHPGNSVKFNFAASGVLLQQIIQGAPVDVFAAADQESMDKAQVEGVIKEKTRADFTGNGLVLITPVDSKLTIKSLNDLKGTDIKHIAIGNPATTPAGRYARAAMQQANVWTAIEPKLVLAENVRQSLNYVGRGEVDAGFVFSTDAKQDAGKVKVVLTIPTVKAGKTSGQWVANPITYPIAEIAHSKAPLASAFITFVRSPEGQTILAGYGFIPLQAKR